MISKVKISKIILTDMRRFWNFYPKGPNVEDFVFNNNPNTIFAGR